jgi:uncharacterized repeat protein (TIGR03803 family)
MLYGTSPYGGASPFGYGTAFQLSRSAGVAWKVTGVYSFQGAPDGGDPQAGLLYHDGALYGTTSVGGKSTEAGAVFRIAP